MIDAARDIGADAVKFQTFRAEEFCGDPSQLYTYRSQGKDVTEPMLDMFKRYEFLPESWLEIKNYCDATGITFFSTPQNVSDLTLLRRIGVPAIKIGSDDFTNLPLIREYAKAKLPLIMSCGMADLADVHRGLDAAGWFEGREVALLLCTSQYPTPASDANLEKLTTLRHSFPGLVVGFSDHTEGPLAAAVAEALGARMFEKHFTLDKGLPGPDHWFSEEPQGLKQWVQSLKTVHELLGSPYVRPTEAELAMRPIARRSIVALCRIEENEQLSAANVGLRRPGGGLPPDMLQDVIGLRVTRAIERGELLEIGDMTK